MNILCLSRNEEKLDTIVSHKLKILDNIVIHEPNVGINYDEKFDCIIFISNQNSFEDLSNSLPEIILKSNNILIELKQGVYFSKSNHINLKNISKSNCRITIRSDGDVRIMATSEDLLPNAEDCDGYKILDIYKNSEIKPNDIFTDGENVISFSIKDYEKNCGVSFVEKLFEKIDVADGLDFRYRLKSNLLPNISNDRCKNLWLWASHSWTSAYEKIDSVVNGYIYITADRDTELYQCPLNTDYKSWKVMPRIKIVNYAPSDSNVFIDHYGRLFLPKNSKSIYRCEKGSFIKIDNSTIKGLEISGIKFIGGNAPLIDIDGILGYTYIHDCEFLCQKDLALSLKTSGSVIENNVFRNSMKTLIDIPNRGFKNHTIRRNVFSNCGQELLNHGCIKTGADSVLIANNIFRNNFISAINVGVWHGAKPQGMIFSIVEDNLIYNDDDFLKNYNNNSLLDVSLIYTYTKNDIAIIRRNRIHGFKTLASGNGIYLDDGAYNINVYNNIITGIEGHLYNINCRKSISQSAKKNAPQYCTNNFIANNIVDGPIRFEIRNDLNARNYPKSIYGGSFFLNCHSVHFNNCYKNVDYSLDKIFNASEIELKIKSDSFYKSKIDNYNMKAYDFIKSWISY